MNIKVTDPEVLMFAGCGGVIEIEFADKLLLPEWEGSPFRWIKSHSIRAIGEIGERLVDTWCGVHNIPISRTPASR